MRGPHLPLSTEAPLAAVLVALVRIPLSQQGKRKAPLRSSCLGRTPPHPPILGLMTGLLGLAEKNVTTIQVGD